MLFDVVVVDEFDADEFAVEELDADELDEEEELASLFFHGV